VCVCVCVALCVLRSPRFFMHGVVRGFWTPVGSLSSLGHCQQACLPRRACLSPSTERRMISSTAHKARLADSSIECLTTECPYVNEGMPALPWCAVGWMSGPATSNGHHFAKLAACTKAHRHATSGMPCLRQTALVANRPNVANCRSVRRKCTRAAGTLPLVHVEPRKLAQCHAEYVAGWCSPRVRAPAHATSSARAAGSLHAYSAAMPILLPAYRIHRARLTCVP
jgi:hypothetical protein